MTGDAGQVLWDSAAAATDTLAKLTALLRGRYGGSRQADKYRMELRLRRRRAGESLTVLHQDIRRLMALAHPTLPQEARESIACDYYIDGLDDPDFALKVRERAPATLDEALRVSLQLEAWSRDAHRARNDDSYRAKAKVRGSTNSTTSDVSSSVDERLAKFENDIQRRFDELVRLTQAASMAASEPKESAAKLYSPSSDKESRTTSGCTPKSAGETVTATPAAKSSWFRRRADGERRTKDVCWRCGQAGHLQRDCNQPRPAPAIAHNQRSSSTRGAKGIDRASVYLKRELVGKKLPCLLDSGCKIFLVPESVMKRAKSVTVLPSTR